MNSEISLENSEQSDSDDVNFYVKFKIQTQGDNLKREQQSLIPHCSVLRNSVNVAVGPPQSGKSISFMSEFIKISKYDPNCHLLVYINKDGNQNDPTLQLFAEDIKCPIAIRRREVADDFIKNLIDFKNMYNAYKDHKQEYSEAELEEIKKNLYVEDFTRPYLHTLIFLEDCGNSPVFTSKTSYIRQLLVECRHIQCSFFITIQSWKMISADIKGYLGMVNIFRGFSMERLGFIYRQLSVNVDFEHFVVMYRKLEEHDYLQVANGKVRTIYS
jgi:hypothetical protein